MFQGPAFTMCMQTYFYSMTLQNESIIIMWIMCLRVGPLSSSRSFFTDTDITVCLLLFLHKPVKLLLPLLDIHPYLHQRSWGGASKQFQVPGLCSGWLKPLRTSSVPIYWASVISVGWGACVEPEGPTPATACSPCFNLARDTEVTAAVPPDSRAASFLWPWENSSSALHQY